MKYTVFEPADQFPYVKESLREVEFDRKYPPAIDGVLEISTRSPSPLGKSLSPFNLSILLKSGKRIKVESAYHASKVFEAGEQYPEMAFKSPGIIVKDKRLKGRKPSAFKFFGKEMPMKPKHAFFDWLYVIGLIQRRDDIFEKIDGYDGFSDMFYSPKKDPNCQARACAKFVSLVRQGLIGKETSSKEILEILIGS